MKVTFGGWYQRTTLHLSEIYEFLVSNTSRLPLSKEKLLELHKPLGIIKVQRSAQNLEFIEATTNTGILIRYYEDGLYLLSLESDNPKEAKETLEKYYNNLFAPAISYIFSLGAPTPKVLANIKSNHPTAIQIMSDNPEKYEVPSEFGEVYSKISSKSITVFKTWEFILIVQKTKEASNLDELVGMQIFFREFKDQLEKYLAIHRTVWEEISGIKDLKLIQGKQIAQIRSRLDSYQQTINLITNRINQMGSYVHTRSSLAKQLKIEDQLITLFQYKFEVLEDTLNYIKEIWKMTSDYLKSAIEMIVELDTKRTATSIKTLQTITSVGVVATILGYLAKDQLPQVTWSGILFFGLLITATLIINYFLNMVAKNTKYKVKFSDRVTNV